MSSVTQVTVAPIFVSYLCIMKMNNLIKRFGWIAVGVVAGALVGWLYWYYIGCENGMCTIKSSPFNMTIYGAVMGGLVFDLIKSMWNKSKTQRS